MTESHQQTTTLATWFVGASFGGVDDQLPRFLAEGVWENGYDDKYVNQVKSMRPGERIAAKSSYTRKHGLPFSNRGHSVSVMSIKAIGRISENPGDGKRVRVDWTPLERNREWYFYTHRGTIWRVVPGDWRTDNLLDFAFEGQPQDIDRFRNDPFWRERFGDVATGEERFLWTGFYEAMADKLLAFRNDRPTLLAGIQEIAQRIDALGYLVEDKDAEAGAGFIDDICPFTVFGMFNRRTTNANRKLIAGEVARILHLDHQVPDSFDGIPILDNRQSWFFPNKEERDTGHFDALWRAFDAAIRLADSDDEGDRAEFAEAFDDALPRPRVAWKLTMGLYWIRPWAFPSLDGNSREYITKKLGLPIGMSGPTGRSTARDYLALIDVLVTRFQEDHYPVHSFPQLSLEAWNFRAPEDSGAAGTPSNASDNDENEDAGIADSVPFVPYDVDSVLRDGCFLTKEELERILKRLRVRKNVILQGPPGTGKTWLAKRLAFAMIGRKDESKVRAVQFHPNLSYEDFVRGWRPTGEGRLSLSNGIFMEAIRAAAKDPSSQHVVVIEEINRGNPAQIFGEMLTLLEAGKRTPSEALELTYPDDDGVRRPVHIPDNLYVIGTMNIADRSLALVDLALRRRFAFVDLQPRLDDGWLDWVVGECGIDREHAKEIRVRVVQLNEQIASDARLGPQFRVGHSYVTPTNKLEPGATRNWFRDVVETELAPLLHEYWFDASGEADAARNRLLEGW